MKPPRSVAAILLALPLLGCATPHSQQLLPGLTYYGGPEKLGGKLVFLLQHDYTLETNSNAAASIYEFALGKPELRKVTDAPAGLFLASEDGTLLCSVSDSNVFVYSVAAQTGRTVTLEAPPADTSLADGHALFVLEETDIVRDTVISRLIDFDVGSGQVQRVELPGASRWQYEKYEGVLWPPGQTQEVHFSYKGYGKRLKEGRDYREGRYALNLSTGSISGPVQAVPGEYDKRFTFKAANGHYIFFEGSGAPAEGFKLVSSPQSDFDTHLKDPQGKQVTVLHNFSKLPALSHGMYLLAQMSPDGRFALVRLQEPVSRKSGMLPGYVNTYYLVDALSGETRVLLKDEMERKTISSMSPVHWVGGAE